jgi:hypothetical protein
LALPLFCNNFGKEKDGSLNAGKFLKIVGPMNTKPVMTRPMPNPITVASNASLFIYIIVMVQQVAGK